MDPRAMSFDVDFGELSGATFDDIVVQANRRADGIEVELIRNFKAANPGVAMEVSREVVHSDTSGEWSKLVVSISAADTPDRDG